MDVDSPVSLKRSSSAPMINELNNTTMTTASTSSSIRDTSPFSIFGASQPRTRRFSASYPIQNALSASILGLCGYPHELMGMKENFLKRCQCCVNAGGGHFPCNEGSPGLPRLTPRVNQLRQEESVDVVGREAAHERELHSAMQMSQSCEDLTIMAGLSSGCKSDQMESRRLETSRMMPQLTPLHLNLPSYSPLCSSPSPTRPGLNRQCFSPSFQSSFKNLSPSPTRKYTTKRSQSPIAMRPSTLGSVKRKFEIDDQEKDGYLSPPAKRPSCGLLMAHTNRLDATSSPLPGSLSSVGTPESLSSADSPGFTYRQVDSPSPGRSVMPVADEPMQEERQPDLSKQDQVMTSVEQSPS